MSFTLRQVTRRAAGGEIVRTKPLAAAEPVVGRGADCDIHLADLAVALRHLRLRQSGPGRVFMEALGELPFEVGHRFLAEAEFRLADAPKIVLGGHVLTLTAGETPDEIVVAVAGVEGPPKGSAAMSERRVFSPAEGVLGKRGLAWIFGLGVLLACLALPAVLFFFGRKPAVIHPDQQWSSGPLSRAHASLGNSCQACHRQAFVAVRDDACLACHGKTRSVAVVSRTAGEVHTAGSRWAPALVLAHADHARLLAATPLPRDLRARFQAVFQRAFHHPNDRCASCHLEHLTADRRPHAAQAMARPARDKPFLVTVNSCVACHARLKSRLPTTILLDTPDWGRHPDFRPLITVSAQGPRPRVERITLTRRPLEYSGLIFSHQSHVAPGGGVARMAQVLGAKRGYGPPLTCANCHRPDPLSGGFKAVDMERDCAACHSLAFARAGGLLRALPHGSVTRVVATLEGFYGAGPTSPSPSRPESRRLPGVPPDPHQTWRRAAHSTQAAYAIRAAFAPGGVCSTCHTIGRPADPASMAFTVAPVLLTARYLPRGGFDHTLAAHRQDAEGRPTCGACHAAKASARVSDVLIPRIAQCAACHGKTKAQTPSAASADCAECHAYHTPGVPTSRRAVLNSTLRKG